MNIKELRNSLKLSQAAFAKSIGVGVSTIANYESGRIKPSDKVIASIKQVYDVDLAAEAPAEKKAAKPAAKKASKPAAEKAAKPAKKPARASKKAAEPQIIIQSPLGGEITPFAILAKVGPVDKIYIRVDKNKAYWVKGDETGSVDLW